MEFEKTKFSVVRCGGTGIDGIKLPVGYRFCPTDEELIYHYLKKKVFHMPFPASVIPEFDVFLTDPWGLPGDLKEKRFFFSKQKNFLKKHTTSGVWKSVGRHKLIFNAGINKVFGLRKSLVFSEKMKTTSKSWVMLEYRLAYDATSATTTTTRITTNSTQSEKKAELGDWAIYCLFQKRRLKKHVGVSSQSKPEVEENQRLAVGDEYEFNFTQDQVCSSSSSGVTELSSNPMVPIMKTAVG